MDKLKDLKDLLVHEVQDLCSVEDQIIDAMPAMIEKANSPVLVSALREHLRITEVQRKRLDTVKEMLGEGTEEEGNEKKGGFLAGLFGGGEHKCKGMEGIISEGNRTMGEDMNPEVLDAAIIAAAQKIEHYEICGYGTSRAYARELGLTKVEELLTKTLNEEYTADDNLTALAVGKLNREAEEPDGIAGRRLRTSSPAKKAAAPKKSALAAAKKSSGNAAAKSEPAKKSGSASKRTFAENRAGVGRGASTSNTRQSAGKTTSRSSSGTGGRNTSKSNGGKGGSTNSRAGGNSSSTSGSARNANNAGGKRNSSRGAAANKPPVRTNVKKSAPKKGAVKSGSLRRR